MSKNLFRWLFVVLVLVGAPWELGAQRNARHSDALVDLLVFGLERIDVATYPPELTAELRDYLKSHPGGPFSEYLPLLAAHRWLCTMEAYKYEKNPKDAARSRRAYDVGLATARESSSVLIRAAADALNARGACFPREQR